MGQKATKPERRIRRPRNQIIGKRMALKPFQAKKKPSKSKGQKTIPKSLLERIGG